MARHSRRHGRRSHYRHHGHVGGLGALGTGAKVGIGLGLLAAAGGALWWFLWRKPAAAVSPYGPVSAGTAAAVMNPVPVVSAASWTSSAGQQATSAGRTPGAFGPGGGTRDMY